MLKEVTLYCDGGCDKNPGGVGGWGVVLLYKEHQSTLQGAVSPSTNNRMELTAAIEGLQFLKEPCRVHVYTDSQYVQKGMKLWVSNWISRNWKGVRNVDLWQQLITAARPHQVQWHWIRGHNGNPGNELADALASQAIKEYKATQFL